MGACNRMHPTAWPVCAQPVTTRTTACNHICRQVRAMISSFRRLRNRLSLRAKFKALWSFFQITSKLDKVYEVPMPSTVANFFKSLPFISIDVDLIGPLECYGVSGFRNELAFALSMPLVISFFVLVTFMTLRMGHLVVLKVRKKQVEAKLALKRAKAKAKQLTRGGGVKRLVEEKRAPVPDDDDGDVPETIMHALIYGFFDALPNLLVVLYGVSPTAYNKVHHRHSPLAAY